jgi:hypothetical protein
VGHIKDRSWRRSERQAGEACRGQDVDIGKALRYGVRYFDLKGVERSKPFPDRQKAAAEAFLHKGR